MTIDKNQVVGIQYKLTEKGGSDVLDSNEGQVPLEFITGKSHIIPGLESQLMGMAKGDKADILVSAADAYGEHNPEAFDEVPREQFAGLELKEGLPLFGQGENGETIQVVVKSFTDDTVTIDYNHPLAGKNLMFAVTVVDVREATDDEVLSGQVGGHQGGGSCGTEGGGGCGCN
jgi:FKBP-type peptidyl-prolyl cis-trans isomerase SlyD